MTIFHSKRRRPLGALLVMLVVGAGSAGACMDAGSGDIPEQQTFSRATRVETLVVTPVTFDETIQLTGAVEAINDATLAAQASGKVDFIAENGTVVEKGTVVARLDQAQALATMQQAEAAMQTAEAQLALARDNYNRIEPLQDRKAISALEFEQARLQVEQAEASVRQLEAALVSMSVQLENRTVRAPFAGTVEYKYLEPGEHAGTGDPLVRVVSVQKVKVLAGVPERYSADVRVGSRVSLSFPSARLEPRIGEVIFVGAAIEPMSRTFPIEVHVANPARDLKPAMLAELQVPRKQHVDVLILPRSAIVLDELGPGVFVVEETAEGTVAKRRPVVLGADALGFVVVESGLDPGDEVIVLGQHRISDGDPVDVGTSHTGGTGASVLVPSLGASG